MFAQAGQVLRPENKPGVRTIVVTRHCPREMYRTNWSIDQFVVAKKLGGGYASTVHLAICKATGTQVAIKVYHRCKLSQLNNYQVQREIRIHSCLDHKNVLQLYAAFEDEVGVYLVTEYASRGDVFGELDRRGGSMTEADAVRQVLSPFLSALEYLHALNIIHRDIKPENLLFTATGVLKVADFGLSIDITQERPVTRVGTLDYMAPEVVICPDKCHPNDHKEKTHLHYTHLVDAWAVGVLAYELTVGRAPFDAGNKRGTIENILHSQPRFPAWISDGARHFVNFSLTKDVAKRPGIQQLAEHPWVHQHAGAQRANQINAGRAVSCHNLSMYTDRSKAGVVAQPRHKVAEPAAATAPQDKFGNVQEEEDDVFVSANGENNGTALEASAVAAGRSNITAPVAMDGIMPQQQQQQMLPPAVARPPVAPVSSFTRSPVPGSAVAVSAAPAAAVSPFAPAAATPAFSAPTPNPLRGVPVLGAAADRLRAFVHRCQSANDIDGLKVFMLQQPPEPSNACFEPGGRFYAGPSAAPAASAHAAASAAAGHAKPAVHDSAASLASSSSSSSSSSRPADLPRPQSANPGANAQLGLAPPRPLQLVKLPAKLCQQMPKSDSCRSLQGLSHIAEGKSEGKVSSLGGGPVPMSPNSKASSLAGAGAGDPMPASPVSPAATGKQSLEQHVRARSTSTQDQQVSSISTSSCSCSYSSSCESALHGSSASISSNHSWGYQQGVEQYQAPQPPSPPCKLSRSIRTPFTPAATAAAEIHQSSGGGSGSHLQQQGSTAAGLTGADSNPAPAGCRNPSCNDLEQLITMCKPGHAVPLTTAHLAGKRTLVSLAADCRGAGQQQQQQQPPVGPGEMLVQGPMEANGCFGFLKSPRR